MVISISHLILSIRILWEKLGSIGRRLKDMRKRWIRRGLKIGILLGGNF